MREFFGFEMREFFLTVVMFLVGAIFSASIGVATRSENYVLRQEVVNHDCASYHPKTGKFTWTNESSGDTQ